MPLKARPMVAAPVPYSWTGFYVGGHFGGGISRNDFGSTNQDINDILPDVCCGAYDALLEAFETGATGPGGQLGVGSHNATGPLGGVQAGYNWQSGRFLLGVEGEYSFANLRGDHQNSSAFAGLINECCFTTGSMSGTLNERFSTNVRGIASIAGRLGIVSDFSDRTLFYVKGGAAWAKTNYALTSNLTGGGTATDFDSCDGPCSTATAAFNGSGVWSGTSNRWGYIAGIGLEYGLFGGWTAKVEYDFMGFGSRDVTLNGTGTVTAECGGSCGEYSPASVTGPSSRIIRVNQDIQVIKLGLNYRFDLGKGPVVARY
jgi:outer membrane immunogenic protein